jgi:hypothetical protein
MFRSFPLVMAMASLAATLFIAVAGTRPHQIYDQTWRSQAEAAEAAPGSVR